MACPGPTEAALFLLNFNPKSSGEGGLRQKKSNFIERVEKNDRSRLSWEGRKTEEPLFFAPKFLDKSQVQKMGSKVNFSKKYFSLFHLDPVLTEIRPKINW